MLLLTKSNHVYITVYLSIILYGFVDSMMFNRTICFKNFNGICVEKTLACPFQNGKEDNKKSLCPDDQRCCIAPQNKDAFTYYSPNCGISAKKGRIFGGFEVKEGEYPWHVAILRKDIYICGGTLIDTKWILTAAHCHERHKEYTEADYIIVLGTVALSEKKSSQETFKVKQIVDHRSYNTITGENDIALFELEKPVKLSPHVNIACLPNALEKFDNMACMASGFGLTEEGKSSNNLLQIVLPTVSLDKCADVYAPDHRVVDKRQICAGYEGGVHDTCNGDSGGPFVCLKTDAKGLKRHIVAGLTSFGSEDCGLENRYAVYTNVAAFLPWIQQSLLQGKKGNQQKLLNSATASVCFNYGLIIFILPVFFYYYLYP